MTVKGQFNPWGWGQMQSLSFADGVSWTPDQISQMSSADTVQAGTGDKTLTGKGYALTYLYTSAGGNDVVADGGWAWSTLKM